MAEPTREGPAVVHTCLGCTHHHVDYRPYCKGHQTYGVDVCNKLGRDILIIHGGGQCLTPDWCPFLKGTANG